ncbi:MAG: DUF1772 domain-containing protein [Phycisphaerales bacterium]
MVDRLDALCIAGAASSGIAAGVCFAFSNFVMPGLRRTPPSGGMEAMQAINRAVYNPLFMVGFLGSTAVGVVALIVALIAPIATDDAHVSTWLAIAGLLQVLGIFVVTAAGNVPLNNRLDRTAPHDPLAPALWAHYLRVWTNWNHLRTVAGGLAAIAYCLAI